MSGTDIKGRRRVGIRRQSRRLFMTRRSGDAMERGREAIKTKHVVGSLQGHRTPHSPRRSPLNLCALIVPSPNTGRPPDSRSPVLLLFPDYFNPSISTSLFPPPSATAGSKDKLTHISALTSPHPFPSPSHPLTTPSTFSSLWPHTDQSTV
jgi:hypothetical protein